MRTDSLIHRFFRNHPGAFFTMIGSDAKKAKDYEFKSVEAKELSFRFDGVFLPKQIGDVLYFFEAQFQKDTDFYLRLFAEIAIYLRQFKPRQRWCVITLFLKKSIDPGMEDHYREFFESGRLQRPYLVDLLKIHGEQFPLNLLRIIVDFEKDVPKTVEEIKARLPQAVPDVREQEKIVDLLINFLLNKFPELHREEIEKMIEPLYSNVKKSVAYQEWRQEILEEEMPKLERRLTAKLEKTLTPQLEKKLTPQLERKLMPQLKKKLAPQLEQKLTRRIARALLQQGLASESVAEATGLSLQEVSSLGPKPRR